MSIIVSQDIIKVGEPFSYDGQLSHITTKQSAAGNFHGAWRSDCHSIQHSSGEVFNEIGVVCIRCQNTSQTDN